jgi:hypothetical protein
MTLAEIEKVALSLKDEERACLAETLLGSLDDSFEIPDAEADRRDQEMDSGEVAPISQEEFVRQALLDRRK